MGISMIVLFHIEEQGEFLKPLFTPEPRRLDA